MSPEADASRTMSFRLRDLSLFEQVVLAVSLILFGVYVLDPFFLERSKALAPEARRFLQTITDIGRSNWMLIPAGSAVALALVLRRTHQGFRNAAGYGLIASTIGFVFVSVGGAGLIANLSKYIIGRARPKLFDTLGPFDFQLFSFTPDHASFPSGHATNIFALATVLAMLWPRGRVMLYTVAAWIAASRSLDRPALFHRRRWGCDPRHGLSLFCARALCRAPLAVRAGPPRRLSLARGADAKLARLARDFDLGCGVRKEAAFRQQKARFARDRE